MGIDSLFCGSRAAEVSDQATVDAVMLRHVNKYNQGEQFSSRFKSGDNRHKLYQLVPENIRVFEG